MPDNKAVVRRLMEDVWGKGDFEAIESLVASDYIDHDQSGMPTSPGRDGLRKDISMYRSAFPDLRMVVEDLIAEGDRVACRWVATGTNTGSLAGSASTNRRVSVTGTVLCRLEGGKIREGWGHWDALSFMQQLGMAPSLTEAPPRRERPIYPEG